MQVHNIPNGECCGSQAYPRSNIDVLCCNGVLNVNVSSDNKITLNDND